MGSLLLSDLFAQLPTTVAGLPFPVVVGAGAIVVLLLLWLMFRGGSRPPAAKETREDIAAYPPPPPLRDVQLTFLNEPVRVRLIVLAPIGRRELPENPEAELDRVVRGLGKVFKQDKPAWRNWAAQLSPKGFRAQFGRGVKLAIPDGETSDVQLVCGPVRLGGQLVMMGMVLLAEEMAERQVREIEQQGWAEQMRVENV